ncbi:MAG: dihydrolipoyl dehydrogenase [Candidatus Hydrogenedentota bacterium]
MDLPKQHTQVAIIGGGPGGYAAAFCAADLGLRVAIINLDPDPGGTCLYRGCIPSKALLHAAKIIREAADAEALGLTFGKPKIDLDKLRESVRGVIEKMTGGLGQLRKARNVEYFQGRAGFIAPHAIRVHYDNGDSREVTFDHGILATGSRPATIPSLSIDSQRVMNSTDALELRDVPKTLLVIGGGYIGLELGSVYAALGSKVTVVEATGSLLPGADADLVRPLAARIRGICQNVYLNTTVANIEETTKGISVTFEGSAVDKPKQVFEKVLICVGRKPNSSGLGLQCTNVQIDERGFVHIDKQQRTSEPGLFAIGDLVGQPMLAHKATHEGRVAAEVIAGKNAAFEPRCIPAVVFTDPEVAWCGLTENEAKAQGRAVVIGKFPWSALSRATTLHRNDGLTKVLSDPETWEVLGVGIVGPGAGEMVAEGALAVELGATAEDLAMTIHAHPTLSESVMEAAEMIYGSSVHLLPPKR